MPHDNLIPPSLPPEEGPSGNGVVPSYTGRIEPGFEFDERLAPRAPQGPNVQRYVTAVLRRKWLLLLALLVGAAGAAGAYRFLSVEYTAQGTLWVQGQKQASPSQVGPIQQAELLSSSSWVELLKSFAVLDPVVRSQRMYLTVLPEYEPAFETFSLAPRFLPGSYTLSVGAGGRRFTLARQAGTTLQTGTLGDSIGQKLGFRWQPPPSAFEAGTQVRFQVRSPGDAARTLRNRLLAGMDKNGNFITVSLNGTNPRKIATVLNAVLDQDVDVAAKLNRTKLDAQLKILKDQLNVTEEALHQAERNLEDFRVKTITLPSDVSTPIAPGLQITQAPVFDRYFKMKIDLEQTRRDRRQLQQAVDSLSRGDVRIESLEAIPEVTKSAEMTQALGELVQMRAQLRTLSDSFTDAYPPIQDLNKRINTIEHVALPRMARAVITQLQTKESQLSTMVDSASVELSQIPPRTIEEARLNRQVEIRSNLYQDLRSRLETAELASAGSIPDIQVLDRASVPEVPTSDKRLRFALMILAGSLGGAIGLAILLDRASGKIQYPDEVGEDIGLDILGSIPRILPPAVKGSADNAARVVEAFRELRVTISFAHGSAGPLVLAVSSPSQEEGKTLIATNLAVAFAEAGRRTLLIDADTRRGDAHRLLGVLRKPGLTDYLLDRTGGDIIQKTTYEHLEFIGCGARGDTTPELLASRRMTTFFGTLKRVYSVVIVDCPPLAAGADTLVLGGLAGNLAVVLRTGSTEKRLAAAKLDRLARFPIRILGAILNDVEPKGSYYRYYGSGSYLPGYRTQAEDEDEKAPDEAARLLATRAATRNGEAGEDLE